MCCLCVLCFSYGDELLFAMTLTILRRKKHEILAITSTEDLLDYVLHKQIRVGLDVEQLLAEMPIGALLDQVSALRKCERLIGAMRCLRCLMCVVLLFRWNL